MKKKLAVLGRGTAGAQAMAHFVRWVPDCEFEWHFDPDTPPQAVGEGSTLSLPRNMFANLSLSYFDLKKFNGTVKTGVYKEGWGATGEEFFHDFPAPQVSLHFNAIELQDYILDRLKGKVKIVHHKTTADAIDADHVMDCSGLPESFDDFDAAEYVPLNAVHVVQCPWDAPRFDYTLTIARPYGWVFGIPLRNRCSIGYMYNSAFNTLEEVKEDIKNVLDRFNLTPGVNTASFPFKSYGRKNNYVGRVAYNGNASFFLEPMEATSVAMMNVIQRGAYDLWFGGYSLSAINGVYKDRLREIETFIMMHYFAGSKFKTPFWEFAQERGVRCMEKASKEDTRFRDMVRLSSEFANIGDIPLDLPDYGAWWVGSFSQNIKGLGISTEIERLFR